MFLLLRVRAFIVVVTGPALNCTSRPISHIDWLSIVLPQILRMSSGRLPRGLGAIRIYCRLTSHRFTFYHPKLFTMATGVLVSDSPTPHHSRNISQATPSSGASSTGIQPNKPTPDEVVHRLLERIKSPLGEAEVRKVVEALEKVSRMHLLPSRRYVKPADGSCCSHNSNCPCIRRWDVSGDS